MDDIEIIDLTPDTIADYGVCGYKDATKHVALRKKLDWFREYYPKGLRIKALLSKTGGYQGMLEYLPGKYAHRPVEADGYLFIHCIFVGFRKAFKGKGYGSALIDACISEVQDAAMHGVAVVTRKGPFMANKDIFLKKGFRVVDNAEPDFDLLALKWTPTAADPTFTNMKQRLDQYPNGLFILRSVQCPYTEKNVNAMIKTANDQFHLTAHVIDLPDAHAVQQSPCAFGTFCIIYDKEILSHHPISNTRFTNILKKKITQLAI
jgi:GNAT superfamily N-acetyltransferase